MSYKQSIMLSEKRTHFKTIQLNNSSDKTLLQSHKISEKPQNQRRKNKKIII